MLYRFAVEHRRHRGHRRRHHRRRRRRRRRVQSSLSYRRRRRRRRVAVVAVHHTICSDRGYAVHRHAPVAAHTRTHALTNNNRPSTCCSYVRREGAQERTRTRPTDSTANRLNKES